MADYKSNIVDKLFKDKVTIWVVRIFVIAVLAAFISSYISFEIKGAKGMHVKYFWAEYNIPNPDNKNMKVNNNKIGNVEQLNQ